MSDLAKRARELASMQKHGWTLTQRCDAVDLLRALADENDDVAVRNASLLSGSKVLVRQSAAKDVELTAALDRARVAEDELDGYDALKIAYATDSTTIRDQRAEIARLRAALAYTEDCFLSSMMLAEPADDSDCAALRLVILKQRAELARGGK
jgi:hypothetical protein